jgi:hypothetical protein
MATRSQDELWIEFTSGPRDGEIIQFTSSPVVIGRGQKADLRLNWDEKAAELHARIVRSDEELTIEPLDDQSSTFVDGREVTQATALDDSSMICVGNTEFVCRTDRTAKDPKAKSRTQTADPGSGK